LVVEGGLFQAGFWSLEKIKQGGTPMQRWQNKIRRLRQFLRGWAKNTNGAYKKRETKIVEESGGTI
jgi:hypothetical protein